MLLNKSIVDNYTQTRLTIYSTLMSCSSNKQNHQNSRKLQKHDVSSLQSYCSDNVSDSDKRGCSLIHSRVIPQCKSILSARHVAK